MKAEDKKLHELYLKKLALARKGSVVDPFESKELQSIRKQRAQKDPNFFAQTYFPNIAKSDSHDKAVQFAKRTLRNKRIAQLIRWGRGLSKSQWGNTFIPAYLYINSESVYTVVVGDNETKATALTLDLQVLFESPLFIHDWGSQINQGRWENGNFATKDGRLKVRALGARQSPRGLVEDGQRPNYINVDDIDTEELVRNPARVEQTAKWITDALIPTMDDGIRRFSFTQNGWHPNTTQEYLRKKLPKWILDEQAACGPAPDYEPYWKAKYPPDHYRYIAENEIGTVSLEQEYRNKPHIEGKIFKAEMINWIGSKIYPRLNNMQYICGHWDVAYAGTATADHNAVRVWGVRHRNFYHIGTFCSQTKMKAPLEWMSYFQELLPPSVIVHWQYESQFWNDEVDRTIEEVEQATGVRLNLVKIDTPKGNKYDRILTLVPYFQNGRIYFHEKHEGDNMVKVANNQLFSIEPGYKTHDDAPDADHQAITQCSKWAQAQRPSSGHKFSDFKSKHSW